MIKKIYEILMSFIDTIYNKLIFKMKKVVCDNSTKINGKIVIRGNGKIVIGKNCSMHSSLYHNPIGGDEHLILSAQKGSQIIIGNHVGISNASIVSWKSIIIEDDVLIGGGVKIYDTNFHSLNPLIRISGKDNDVDSKPIVIHKKAFIGAHSIILKGVEIGECSIVGAGSVVTKSIPPYEIWAGNPAKFLKKIEI